MGRWRHYPNIARLFPTIGATCFASEKPKLAVEDDAMLCGAGGPGSVNEGRLPTLAVGGIPHVIALKNGRYLIRAVKPTLPLLFGDV